MTTAQQELFDAHQGNVVAAAQRLLTRLPAQVELDDLVSDGRVGLLKAVRAFDPDAGVPFWGFATLRVNGAMIDGIRQDTGKRCHKKLGIVLQQGGHFRTGLTAGTRAALVLASADAAKNPEAIAIAADGRRFLFRSLEQCPHATAREVVLSVLEGHQVQSIAARYGKSPSWAAKQVGIFVQHAQRQLQRGALCASR